MAKSSSVEITEEDLKVINKLATNNEKLNREMLHRIIQVYLDSPALKGEEKRAASYVKDGLASLRS